MPSGTMSDTIVFGEVLNVEFAAGEMDDSITLIEQLFMEITNFTPMFATVPEADRYFSGLIYGQLWDVQTLDIKNKALISATRNINTLQFAGRVTTVGQPLEWPRNGTLIVPDDIKMATYEEAFALLKGVDPETELLGTFVSSRVFGKVRTDYDYRTSPHHIVAGLASMKAFNILMPYLAPNLGLRIHRGS